MSVRGLERGETLLDRLRTNWALWLLILPGLVYFLIFQYLPLFGYVIAFQDYLPFLGFTQSAWVGLENFQQMFADSRFWDAVVNTLVISGLQLVLFFPAPIVLAIVIDSLVSTRVRRLVQSVIYLPHFISWVIVVSLFQHILGGTGLVAQGLRGLGLPAPNLMADPGLFKWMMVLQLIWKESGWGTIIYLAALLSIDQALYEAAAVDGAGRWRRLWHITLPGLVGITVLLAILRLGQILSVGFEQILLQRDFVGPGAGEVLDTYVYYNGIVGGQWSLTAAAGLIKGVVGAGMVFAADRVARHFWQTGIFRGQGQMSELSATAGAQPVGGPLAQDRKREDLPWKEPLPLSLRMAKGVVLFMVVTMVVLPFLSVLGTSLASDRDVINSGGFVLVPMHPTLEAYATVFRDGIAIHALWVSIGITLVGSLVSIVLTTMMAYGLARSGRGIRVIVYLVLFTMLFTPGIIPSYLVVKQFGLLGSYASLILPVAINVFNLIVMRQFFMEIPTELMDSARIDGAGEFRILWSIVLPLSKPVIAVIGLFYAVSYWNAFFNALLYLNDNSQWPLQLIVRMYVLQGSSLNAAGDGTTLVPQTLQMAVVILAVVPILLVYPFLQRYFTSGVLSGAIKG